MGVQKTITKEQLQALIQQAGPGALQQLQEATTPEYLTNLPEPCKKRVEALAKLQSKHDEIEEEFNKEFKALQAKYDALYTPLYDERRDIVTGVKEAEGVSAAGDAPKGIPDFWLHALQNLPEFADNITEKDAEILKFVEDIRAADISETDEDGNELGGFKLIFTFSENPFFTNKTLEKEYVMDGEDMLIKTRATPIEWHEGKNVTVKLVKKKTRKGKVTKEEKTDSFFNFFSSLDLPEEIEDEEDDNLQFQMEEDYQRGDAIRDNLLPNALGFYTGEAVDDQFEFDGGDDEDDEDDEEGSEEDSDEEEENVKTKGVKGGKKGGAPAAGAAPGGEQAPECKQQ